MKSTEKEIIPEELLITQSISLQWNGFYHILVNSDEEFRMQIFNFAELSVKERMEMSETTQEKFDINFLSKIGPFKDNEELWASFTIIIQL